MEQNKFEWTDELVCEFASKMLMDLYTNNDNINKPQNHIANFKASKTKPKEYEILEFSVDFLGSSDIQFYLHNNSYIQRFNDVLNTVDISEAQKAKSFKIKSVRRLSDNEVFSIGDEVTFYPVQNIKWVIDNFFIKDDGTLLARSKDNINVEIVDNNLAKIKIILTTHDGKDIYELQSVFPVSNNFETHEITCNQSWYNTTKEAAEQFCLFNEKILSVNDVVDCIKKLCDGTYNNDYHNWDLPNKAVQIINPLIELAKSKTKQ